MYLDDEGRDQTENAHHNDQPPADHVHVDPPEIGIGALMRRHDTTNTSWMTYVQLNANADFIQLVSLCFHVTSCHSKTGVRFARISTLGQIDGCSVIMMDPQRSDIEQFQRFRLHLGRLLLGLLIIVVART